MGAQRMTQQEKQRIAVLRSSGMSYGVIATELEIPVNSVKTFCRRNHLGGVRGIENLSGESGDIDLIKPESRGNSTTANGEERPAGISASASQQAKVRLVFSDNPDEDAISDVLGMLMRSRIRQG